MVLKIGDTLKLNLNVIKLLTENLIVDSPNQESKKRLNSPPKISSKSSIALTAISFKDEGIPLVYISSSFGTSLRKRLRTIRNNKDKIFDRTGVDPDQQISIYDIYRNVINVNLTILSLQVNLDGAYVITNKISLEGGKELLSKTLVTFCRADNNDCTEYQMCLIDLLKICNKLKWESLNQKED
jgi:hypothetical protein